MASSADQLISTLLKGTGFGQTPGDVTTQNLQNQEVAQQVAQQKITNTQAVALNAAKLQDMQRQTANDASFQSDWANYLKNPTTDGIAQIAVKYPSHADAVKEFWAIKSPEARESNLRAFSEPLSALQNNRPDLAIQGLTQLRDASAKAGQPTDDLDSQIAALKAGDKDGINAVKGTLMMHIAAIDKDGTFSENLARTKKALSNGDPYTLGPNDVRYDGDNTVVARGVTKPTYEKIANADGSESLVQVGGDAAASGGASGGRGDVSRLINTDAGGGYVPDSVKTLGQFVGFGKSLNARGAKSSSAGTYQINGTTMAEFGPKALGPDWKSAPFNADTQDKVGEAIFNWAKQQPDPAKALRGRWVSLDPQTAANIVQGDWSQARGVIAQGETGGGAGASAAAQGAHSGPIVAAAGTPTPPGVKVLYTSKPADAGQDASTIDFYGQKVAAGGDLPPLGMGKQAAAMRQAILARAAQIQQGQGMSGSDSNLLHADVKTATTALAALQKTRNGLNPYLQTFDGASAQVRALAPQGVGGSIPIFNRWIQSGRTNVSGDPAVSKFNVAINAVANENAKIMSGASGGAVSSDSARREAMDLINNAQTLPQLYAVLDQMHTDTQIRMKSLDDRQASLRATISGKGSSTTASTGGPVKVTSRAQAMALKPGTVFITPDGRRLVR